MNFRKNLVAFSILCLVSVLFLPVSVFAEPGGSSSTLTTAVPETHTVELVIEGSGTVKIGDEEYRSSQTVEVTRLSEQEYEFGADTGWTIKEVRYGMEDEMETVTLNGTKFTAPKIYQDGNQLHVIFEEKTSNDTDSKPDPDPDSGTNGGDTTKPPAGGNSGGNSSNTNGNGTGNNVPTGDNMNGILLLVLVAGSGITAYSLYRKKGTAAR